MPSRFMAARVGQFFTSHFLTAKYLHRFHHLSTPMCECYDVVDTCAHLLLECRRWEFSHQRLGQWLSEERTLISAWVPIPPTWTWRFLVQTGEGRVWLGRFFGGNPTSLEHARPAPVCDWDDNKGGDSGGMIFEWGLRTHRVVVHDTILWILSWFLWGQLGFWDGGEWLGEGGSDGLGIAHFFLLGWRLFLFWLYDVVGAQEFWAKRLTPLRHSCHFLFPFFLLLMLENATDCGFLSVIVLIVVLTWTRDSST